MIYDRYSFSYLGGITIRYYSSASINIFAQISKGSISSERNSISIFLQIFYLEDEIFVSWKKIFRQSMISSNFYFNQFYPFIC